MGDDGRGPPRPRQPHPRGAPVGGGVTTGGLTYFWRHQGWGETRGGWGQGRTIQKIHGPDPTKEGAGGEVHTRANKNNIIVLYVLVGSHPDIQPHITGGGPGGSQQGESPFAAPGSLPPNHPPQPGVRTISTGPPTGGAGVGWPSWGYIFFYFSRPHPGVGSGSPPGGSTTFFPTGGAREKKKKNQVGGPGWAPGWGAVPFFPGGARCRPPPPAPPLGVAFPGRGRGRGAGGVGRELVGGLKPQMSCWGEFSTKPKFLGENLWGWSPPPPGGGLGGGVVFLLFSPNQPGGPGIGGGVGGGGAWALFFKTIFPPPGFFPPPFRQGLAFGAFHHPVRLAPFLGRGRSGGPHPPPPRGGPGPKTPPPPHPVMGHPQLDALASKLRGGRAATLAGVKCGGGSTWRFEPEPPRRS
jgi:hypothetical protein